ncbi:hypothetical protein G9F73_008365 [Clostridium estertheticum]|uniref:hypothetical protein n=1 Tax=Clostridium estertheticum TaxID=238834 RepID=UPI0013EED59B|nr:hypothetical protein [Clostridium estertheticum]MBZ9607825.1 hypothetical protein [Clostridium estertheticum]
MEEKIKDSKPTYQPRPFMLQQPMDYTGMMGQMSMSNPTEREEDEDFPVRQHGHGGGGGHFGHGGNFGHGGGLFGVFDFFPLYLYPYPYYDYDYDYDYPTPY